MEIRKLMVLVSKTNSFDVKVLSFVTLRLFSPLLGSQKKTFLFILMNHFDFWANLNLPDFNMRADYIYNNLLTP